MVMHDFDACDGEAASRTNTNITAVRMGCSVVGQYGRRRNCPRLESGLITIGLNKWQIRAHF
jgi:hypothetical protein